MASKKASADRTTAREFRGDLAIDAVPTCLPNSPESIWSADGFAGRAGPAYWTGSTTFRTFSA